MEEQPGKAEAAIVTVSDKGAGGERRDTSGETLERLLHDLGFASVRRELVPDERERIAAVLRDLCDGGAALILTTGGTGLAPRDVTPEATLDVIERIVPGFAEAIRSESLRITPRAMLSRAVSGIRGRSLIINLPGSPKACEEAFAIIRPALEHALDILRGAGSECAR